MNNKRIPININGLERRCQWHLLSLKACSNHERFWWLMDEDTDSKALTNNSRTQQIDKSQKLANFSEKIIQLIVKRTRAQQYKLWHQNSIVWKKYGAIDKEKVTNASKRDTCACYNPVSKQSGKNSWCFSKYFVKSFFQISRIAFTIYPCQKKLLKSCHFGRFFKKKLGRYHRIMFAIQKRSLAIFHCYVCCICADYNIEKDITIL